MGFETIRLGLAYLSAAGQHRFSDCADVQAMGPRMFESGDVLYLRLYSPGWDCALQTRIRACEVQFPSGRRTIETKLDKLELQWRQTLFMLACIAPVYARWRVDMHDAFMDRLRADRRREEWSIAHPASVDDEVPRR